MKKRYLTILSLFIIVTVFLLGKENNKSIVQVLEEAWDTYGLVSYQVGETDSVITIFMDENKDQNELKKYLEKNIKKEDLKDYTIEIYKKNMEQLLYENDLTIINREVYLLLKDEYKTKALVQVSYDDKPTMRITLPKGTENSVDQINEVVEEFLATNSKGILIHDLVISEGV